MFRRLARRASYRPPIQTRFSSMRTFGGIPGQMIPTVQMELDEELESNFKKLSPATNKAQTRIAMVAPFYFDVFVKDQNAYMQMKRGVNKFRAYQQWSNLVETIESTGTQVSLIKPIPNLPDMVFAANLGLIYGDKAVAANFEPAARWGEAYEAEDWLFKSGFDTYRPDAKYEGQGDSLVDSSGRIWFGYGFRSSPDAAHEIAEFLQPVEYHPLELVMGEYYHLDTCFCPLENGEVLVHKPAFTTEGYNLIMDKFGPENVIHVDENDAANFVCNSINVNRHVICNKMSSKLQREVESRGYKVLQNPMSEFLLSGGSTKCCILHLTTHGAEKHQEPQKTAFQVDPIGVVTDYKPRRQSLGLLTIDDA